MSNTKKFMEAYVSPHVERTDITVEAGFAMSTGMGADHAGDNNYGDLEDLEW